MLGMEGISEHPKQSVGTVLWRELSRLLTQRRLGREETEVFTGLNCQVEKLAVEPR